MKTFIVSFSILLIVTLISVPSMAQQQTLPTDLRQGFTQLENKMGEYQSAATLFRKTYATDSSKLSYVISQLNSIKVSAKDARFLRNEKYSQLTAEFSSLASNVLQNMERTILAENAIVRQVDELLVQTEKRKQSSDEEAGSDLLSVDNLVLYNNNRAENYLNARDALSTEIGNSGERMDDEVNTDISNRAQALESAANVMSFLKQVLAAGGVQTDSNLSDIHSELLRLRNSLRNERQNRYIAILPYIRFCEEIGPTLALRQILSRVIASNQDEGGYPSFKGLTLNVPPIQSKPAVKSINSFEIKTSGSTKRTKEPLQKARQAMEQRRTIEGSDEQ